MKDRIIKRAFLFYSLAKEYKELYDILDSAEKLDTYKDRESLLEKKLKRISSGSSRIVYSYNNDIVVKFAKNEKGIAQNKAESNIKIKSKYVNKVIDKSKKYNWITCAYLDDLKEKDFKELIGYSFKDISECFLYSLKKLSDSKYKKPKNFDEISKTSFYKDILNIAEKYKLMPGDLSRISSWKKKNNNPVLVDMGLTKKVYDDYYDSSEESES